MVPQGTVLGPISFNINNISEDQSGIIDPLPTAMDTTLLKGGEEVIEKKPFVNIRECNCPLGPSS